MIQHDIFEIKKLVVDTNNEGKLIAHLPKSYWEEDKRELLHNTIQKLDKIGINDIEVEEINTYDNNKVFTISIHKFLRYALIKQPNGDVSFKQLDFDIEN
ncbi:hypothetical protein [Staphylococcus gallinarum]|uniref:hypothetical protein n=1 Tax=Staphylococcus gallinarum TaxID=1293 RepID=UPI0030BED3DB